MNQHLMKLRDLGRMRAHHGWLHFLCGKVMQSQNQYSALPRRIQERLARRTDDAKADFDRRHGIETSVRCDVNVKPDTDGDAPNARWGYSAICRDFLLEILKSIPRPLSNYAFVDVGSGKGAVTLHASEFPFRRFWDVELTRELIEMAPRNVEQFEHSTGRSLAVEWVHTDFFVWKLPREPLLVFLNNPFPDALNVPALQHIESSIGQHPRPALLVFRKASLGTADYLDRSALWRPQRPAPYWRVYEHTGRTAG